MPMRPIVSDQVCNSLGSDVSCILRPGEGRTTHRLVGEAYVHSWSLFNLRECSNEKIVSTSLVVLEARNSLTAYSG